MNQEPVEPSSRHRFTQTELEVIGDYLPELRRSLSDQSIVRTYLAIGFVLGLIAQVAGYLLRQNATGELYGLAVDLLYALGWSLWTGVVVSYFVQILPEAKRRQIVSALDAYEKFQREKPVRDTDIPV